MTLIHGFKLTLSTAALLLITQTGHAAVTAMTNATLTSAVDNQEGLVSFDAGSASYNSISVGTVSPDSLGNTFYWKGGGDSIPPFSGTGSPSDANDALDDAHITTGIFGTGTYKFDTDTVNAGDDKVFFVIEMGGNDDGIVVNALDGSNNVIAGYALTLNGSDYAKVADVDWNGNVNNDAYGTTFTIADFGDGNLASISGIEIVGASAIDVSQVGIATAIPEPASLMLMGLGGLMILGRKRSAV